MAATAAAVAAAAAPPQLAASSLYHSYPSQISGKQQRYSLFCCALAVCLVACVQVRMCCVLTCQL
jgi:hypothetical protein